MVCELESSVEANEESPASQSFAIFRRTSAVLDELVEDRMTGWKREKRAVSDSGRGLLLATCASGPLP